MGAHDFKLHYVSRSAAPKLALVPASSYNCDVKASNLNVCAKFHCD